jgi:hypothetical protein
MLLLNLPTPVPSREERLPKEIEKSKFPRFLDEAKEKFPKGEFLVQYIEDDNKIIILEIGNSGSCAHQTTQALKKEPSLKQRGNLKLEMLKPPEAGYLLR